MNEAEFIVRRIIKEANNWSKAQFEEKQNAPVGSAIYYRNKRMAQVELIDHLIETFTEGEKDESREDSGL